MTKKNPFTRAAEISDKKAETLLAKAGRKPLATRDPAQEPIINEPAFAGAMEVMRIDEQSHALAESQHQAHVRAVAAQVGYQLPNDCADPDLIQRDIAINMRRTAEAMLQVGLGLICLKEACRHGEFIARLEVLNFEPRVARRYMQVSRKFSNRSTSSVLLKAIDQQSKLLELIVLDDEQIEELALTGETGELKLDDVASMSVKELRAAVRELRGEKDANEKLLAHKNKQLDEAALIKTAVPDERINHLLAEAHRLTREALVKIGGELRQAIAGLDATGQETGTGVDWRPLLSGLLGQLQQSLTVVRDEFMIEDIIGDGTPEWVRATAGLDDDDAHAGA